MASAALKWRSRPAAQLPLGWPRQRKRPKQASELGLAGATEGNLLMLGRAALSPASQQAWVASQQQQQLQRASSSPLMQGGG